MTTFLRILGKYDNSITCNTRHKGLINRLIINFFFGISFFAQISGVMGQLPTGWQEKDGCSSQLIKPGKYTGKSKKRVFGALQPVDIRNIEVGGELGRRIDLTINNNLLALNFENDFIAPFALENRGTAPSRQSDQSIMESVRLLPFNGLGETLDALVFFAAYSDDPEVNQLRLSLFNQVHSYQDQEGYIGQYIAEPEKGQLFRQFTFEDAAFLCLALARNYYYFNDVKSLNASKHLMEYLTDAQRKYHPKFYTYSAISFCDAALLLYRCTGQKVYLDIARSTKIGPARTTLPATLDEWQNDSLFSRGWKKANEWRSQNPNAPKPYGEVRMICHVYRYLERLYTQLQLYRILGDPNYLRMSRKFQQAVFREEKGGLTITGGLGYHEGWNDEQEGTEMHGETCATSYTLAWLAELMNLEQSQRFGDVMERVIYNQLFAAQAPDGRDLRYFTPFSGPREYFNQDTYCCPGNFRRAISKLPQLVFFRLNDGIAINLYTKAKVGILLTNSTRVELSMETDYPNNGEVLINVLSCEADFLFPLYLRIPRWCRNPSVLINGVSINTGLAGEGILRQWKTGDSIRISLPMSWRWIAGRELQEGRAALLWGPQVYCLNPARNHLPNSLILRDMVIDPSSVEGPFEDNTIRPGGQFFKVKAWSPGKQGSGKPDYSIELTEFADPGGEEVFFILTNPVLALKDELIED
jgi:uncharacterized protein